MKRIAFTTAGVLVTIAIALTVYWHSLFLKFPEHTVTAYTGITNQRTVQKVHSDYDWYLRSDIQASDGERVLKRYAFKSGFSRDVLQGKLDNAYVADCQDCWSYYEGKGHGPYGYVLIVLSADKKQLQMYELFGD
jgi:hypothetical protein